MISKKGFLTAFVCVTVLFSGCAEKTPETNDPAADDGLEIIGGMKLEYAEQFSADYCKNGCSIITVGDDRFLLVPENTEIPEFHGDMTVISQPPRNIYNAASSSLDLFDALGELYSIKMISTNRESWSLPAVIEGIDSENLTFIGKYSSPDYEMLAAENCGLAIESTMIYHTPAVKERIESLGIPVLVERSSYESHPLGRTEWIKLYGLLLGIPEKAEEKFSEITKTFDEMNISEIGENEKKTAAFFYVTSNGYVVVRKPHDYAARMIELAGGSYIFTAEDLGADENALSTSNIQFETFYQKACDADFLIYNSTIDGKLDGIADLIGKNQLFADFKAVKEGNVWCTEQNMFQQTTGAADMINDMYLIFSGKSEKDELTYLYRLK